MRNSLVLIVFVSSWLASFSQDVQKDELHHFTRPELSKVLPFAPNNSDYEHYLDRAEILGALGTDVELWNTIKPISIQDLAENSHSFSSSDQLQGRASRLDMQNLNFILGNYYYNTNTEKQAGWLYKNKFHFFSVDHPDIQLALNPVIDWKLGRESGIDELKFIGTKGFLVHGNIGNKVAFHSYFTDNQANFMEYVHDRTAETWKVLPGEGRTKNLGSSGNRFLKDGVDYLSARGYINFKPIEQIDVQFGNDKLFIGNGFRSLFLSDYGNSFLFLRLNTQVWKISYQNIFTQFVDYRKVNGADGYIPRKYGAFHHIGIQLTPNLEVGLFEGTVFAQQDSTFDAQFEPEYLNPLIFYRSVEYHLGSSDNVVLGLDFKYNALNAIQIYGQLLLDELKVGELRAGNGWWANKFAIQLGGKYIDVFGLKGLDGQLEMNLARPFTYSHTDDKISYSHMAQPLAHPLGANFREIMGSLRYQPTQKLMLTAQGLAANFGKDAAINGQNFGSNILRSNLDVRDNPYGHTIGQGVDHQLIQMTGGASYMVMPNMWLELEATARNLTIDGNTENSIYLNAGLRMNIDKKSFWF